MRGKVTNEIDVVGASADEIWAVYSSPELPTKIVFEITPGVIKKLDLLEGDGGAGSVLDVELAEVFPEPRSWKEKFMKIDHETRTKVIRHTEGGYLNIGFNLYEETFEIIEKDANSCIIRATLDVDIDEDEKFQQNASRITVDAFSGLGKAVSSYVIRNKSKN
ncbi:Bet v I domain [Macleaya cordata]|uniref:Bet v I domain n=1 Tax=Macleaya cordata TaxID=56857 RepID=A0A200PXG7_MACCD|nr:Bet v I domain [Macleaya cordata]